MSIKKEIQNSFHDLIHMLTGGAVDFFEALATSIEENGGKVLRDAAMEAVIAAEANGGTGEDKLKAAFTAVVATLEKEGLPIVTNAIKGAIEAAVAKMRSA